MWQQAGGASFASEIDQHLIIIGNAANAFPSSAGQMAERAQQLVQAKLRTQREVHNALS